MVMTLRQAAQQALSIIDGMEQNYGNLWQVNASPEELDELCTALRAALAEQPAEQEPVAWRVQRNDGQYELYFVKASAERAAECYIKRPQVDPLYTAPQPRRRLTDEEIEEINVSLTGRRDLSRLFARAIEDAIWRDKT